MFLLLVFVLSTASSNALTCHCSGNTMCGTNGYCPTGCEDGWSGPGCQVGNVALHKSADQSTTFSGSRYTGNASLAVDGKVPSLRDASEQFCSHTALDQSSAWWYVTLSTTHDFVITSVTLVNRNDALTISINNRLQNFVIIYSNETAGNPDPNNSAWNECVRQLGLNGYNTTYACNGTAIAKRVAVYMLNFSNPILALCEVKVFGYQLYDCHNGFTGPGCLLRACNDQCISAGGTCDGEYGSCRYDVCPDRSLLPPDCWITLSNYSAVEIQSVATCNTVQFFAEMNYPQPNIAATMLLLQVSNPSSGLTLVNVTMPVLNTTFYSYNDASPGATYDVFVTPLYCSITQSSCFYSTGSKVFTSVIGKRDYQLSKNQSCLFVYVKSSTAGCELPTAIKINCTNNYTSKVSANSSSFISCGLEEGLDYECSVTATIDETTNRFDHLTFNQTFLTILETSTATPPTENKTGIVAGSIVGVVVVISIISIIAVVYRRRQRSAKASEAGSNIGSNVVHKVTTMPSSCSASHSQEEQHDNLYESLDQRSRFESAGDYAELK